MIPSPNSFIPPPAGNQSMNPSTNKLSQQMQDMTLGPPVAHPGSRMPMGFAPVNQHQQPGMQHRLPGSQYINYGSANNNQHPMSGNQPPSVISPQHKVHGSTTVTYSGPPRAMYPYHNSASVYPNSQTSPVSNQFDMNLQNTESKSMNSNHESKVGASNPTHLYSQPPLSGMQQNGMSNGHDDGNIQNNQKYSSQPPPSQNQNFQQVQYSHMSPPTMSSPVQQQYPPPPGTPSNLQQSFPPSQMFNSVPSTPAQNSFQTPQPPPVGMSPSSPTYPPPGSPMYSGMSAGSPPSGGMWQNQQYSSSPGAAQSHGGYPYSAQNQGMPPPQQQQTMVLDQMPSTVQVREEDRKLREGYYTTDVKGVPPPLVTTDFVVQDRGMCSPRFIRSSVYCLPNQPDILKLTGIPFTLTIAPMASISEGEISPPQTLYRELGPLRCKRCKAYICPFMTFMEGGRCFQCAFCKVVTEVPQDYFCFLDGMGERTDKYHRPELCLGSYEYLGTKEYCRNEQLPNPPAYIFMIEVSHATFRNGLVPLLCENMKNVLQCLKNDEHIDASKLRIGFVTYNNVLHFYNMKKNLTQPHIMVLSDVHNAFVPLQEGFLVTLSEAEVLVESLMEHIPRLFVNEPATEVILGPVIQVGLEALKNANCSGKLLVFHSTIPNADAPGKLCHREGQKLLNTDKQKTILSPQHDYYSKLAQECVAAGCAVDLFLFPNAYIDIASLSPLCRHTGGQIYKYTYFQSHIDGDRFLEDLERNVTTPTAFDAVLRVRTSAGISPIFYYGNFYMSNTTDVELSAIDCHKAITIELAYDDKLPENEIVYIQAALLYTTITGERKIRVHNLALITSVGMQDVFKSCELDTIIHFFAKQALKQVLENPPQQIKSNLVSRSVKILSCYRKHCASGSTSGQLILPESMKLLPLYINCLLKSDAIAGGSEMSVDDRSFAMLAMNSMDIKSTAIYFYPTLMPLHDVDPDSDLMPNSIRCSIEKLNDSGAYLLENGIYMFLWIGQAISPKWLQDVFGVQSPNQVDKQKTSLPELNTPLSQKIRSILEELEEGRQWYMRLTVMVQGDKLEVVFRQFLVEDRGTDGSASYVEFLCHLYKEISKTL